MKKQNNNILNIAMLLLLNFGLYGQNSPQVISRQGQVSFFSYTSVENIEAINNQALSILDRESGEIAVQILLRAFVFKKALMQEHFNESYVESDTYPKLFFEGKVIDLDVPSADDSPKFIKGEMDFHGVKKEVEIKTVIEVNGENLTLFGNFIVPIDDFNIKVPPLLAPNIAKEIQVKFRFEYVPFKK